MPVRVAVHGTARTETVPTMLDLERILIRIAAVQALVIVGTLVIAMAVQTWILIAVLGA